LSSIPFPQHDLLIHKHLLRNLAFGRAKEYFLTTRTLAPFSPSPTSSDTTSTLTALHPKSNDSFSLFVEDYKSEQDIELSSNSFKLTFQCMSHLLANGHFRMVFEHLQDYFHPKDSMNEFP
jgi:hypothetical protein